jgi:hypothetical protein
MSMTVESAETLLYVITAAGALAWLAGLQFTLRSFPGIASRRDDSMQPLEEEEKRRVDWIYNSADVKGQPTELVSRATAALVAGAIGIGPVKILETGDDRIVFEGVAYNPSRNQMPVTIGHGQLRFVPLGPDQTSVQCVVQVSGMRWMLWVALGIQCLGLIALIAGFWLIYALAAHNPNPEVRWQTFQMLQTVHFLWPPFMFAGMFRYGRKTIRNGLELFVHNLPY